MQLLTHAVGPLVAIGMVTVMPVIWAAFADLDHGLPVGATTPEYRRNAPDWDAKREQATAVRIALLVERARQLLADGKLPDAPSAARLRESLGCGTDTAREVRDALRREEPRDPD